ncbi:MAG TPA: hypothetical protein VGM94_07615 [Galbitalea sp.]|jgi:hypothetical protein
MSSERIEHLIHEYAVVRGDLSEQYARDQLRDKILAALLERIESDEMVEAVAKSLANSCQHIQCCDSGGGHTAHMEAARDVLAAVAADLRGGGAS